MANKDNMKIWDALGKTDPAHTKQFTRAGGFKGTAIKPMWANKQMTEFFGPCGIGWGTSKPEYQLVPVDGEILVFCTVSLWYKHEEAVWEEVWGQGGDKVVARGKDGFRSDDEAFKKAYTDALSNAMKFIGVGADVHMGQFEDNKYVQSVAREFEEEKKAEVFAEVERQKSNVGRNSVLDAEPKTGDIQKPSEAKATLTMVGRTGTANVPTEAIPPELDWSYNKASGVLICRVVDVKMAKKKIGEGEFVAVKLNQAIDGKDVASYFHATHIPELLAAKGKVCKFLTIKNAKGYLNIDRIREIDGNRLDESAEELARLLGSVLDFDDEDLREVHAHHNGDWAKVVAHLKDLKQRKDEEGSAV